MDLLFHQIAVFILMMIYVPVTMVHTIFMIKEKGWLNRICYVVIASSLIINLPNVIKNYQQYLMGHFSGLPEVITKSQLIADTVVMVTVTLVIICCIYIKIRTWRIFYAYRYKKYLLEH